LGTLYDAFAQGRPSPLPDLSIQYADYAVWQKQWMQGEVLDGQLAYWKDQLRGTPQVLKLPFDRPRPAVQSFRGAVVSADIAAPLAGELKKLSQREDVTLFMTLVTGFQTLLSRYSSQEQFIVGTDLANRTSVDTERLIGFFINVLPLRADLSGDPIFRDLLRRVRETSLGAYAHQDMPFDKLVEELSPERSLSHNPLVQVLFVMLNAPDSGHRFPGLQVAPFELELTKSKFDLALFIQEKDGGIAANWLYSTDVFDASTIERMAGHYMTLLGSIAAQPEARISALEMLSASEQALEEVGRKQHQQIKVKQLKTAKRKSVAVEGRTIPIVSKE
jgi:non-ribosomal peptide synthetase component F